jgi:peroxiredoxin Q/BCP
MTIELKPGDAAPSFEAQDADGKTWNLDELRGKRVVLYFYPADFTPG